MDVNKVFLIDDDYIFRTAAEVLIISEGLTNKVVHHENGLEAYDKLVALEKTPNELPNVILLDINMPIMNGWEFLEELKMAPHLINEQVHIYILTSSIAPEDLNLSKEYGFIRGYITKPLTKADLKKIKTSVANPYKQV